ncbi:C4-dicarboxylate transport transcriptional regulatory protein DctD [Devosia equisanguinis]|uniref:C4-dicarboxylate transport transcriptional regulatory protein DctD n=1 Tax=Devosia equisanguinis TaxID=2490941 RepID=A0A3S4CB91_9HYPH|nr:response regulator [Devosia equisanguinis]VDS04207.1 C4-dicarboxylate transport transcriptional regulatory protein DctD [Devosia equisanguinis]
MSAAPASVLIADDGVANRLSLRLELEDRGLVVTEVWDGASAQLALTARSYDAVISDMWMPGTDGHSLVRALQAQNPDILVLVVTGGGSGLADPEAIARKWHAERVYLKPFDLRTLVGDLVGLLEARRSGG